MPRSTSSWGRLHGGYSLSPPEWRDNPCTREGGQRKRWEWLFSPNPQPKKQKQSSAETVAVKGNGDRSEGKSAGSRMRQCKGGGAVCRRVSWVEENDGEGRAERRSLKEMVLLEWGQCNSAKVGLQVCEVALGEGKAKQQLACLVSFLHCGAVVQANL